MKTLSFVIALCMAAAAATKDTPTIPCTFSCGYYEELAYRVSSRSDKRTDSPLQHSNLVWNKDELTGLWDYKYEFNWYNVEGKRMCQNGIEPETDNTSVVWEYPNAVTIVSPFFDRFTCSTLPNEYVYGKCPGFNKNAKYYSTSKCPYNASEECDLFIYMSPDYSTATDGYFYKDTNIPHAIIIETEDYTLTEKFTNFIAEEPDDSHFKAPKGVQCTVIIDDVNKTSEAARNGIFNGEKSDYINAPDNIKQIQASAKTWKAGYSKYFGDMTRKEMSQKLFPVLKNRHYHTKNANSGSTRSSFIGNFGIDTIPTEYDTRKQYTNCNIETIRDQGSCGSCWAFGAVEALEDRICIHSGGNSSIVLSPQYLVSCDKNNAGCSGGYLDQAWYGLRDVGTCTEECFAYKAKSSTCINVCEDGSPMKKYKSVDAYSVFVPFEYERNMRLIQEEIMKNGPVEAAFYVFDDFYNYVSGVYIRTKGSSLAGGHAIKIIGWGVDAETSLPYWTVANSWGTEWGEGGFFRILRGSNECGIEAEIAAGIPNFA